MRILCTVLATLCATVLAMLTAVAAVMGALCQHQHQSQLVTRQLLPTVRCSAYTQQFILTGQRIEKKEILKHFAFFVGLKVLNGLHEFSRV